MASARYAWGIDVGNRALKAVKLVRDAAGQLKISDFEVIEHETVLSNAGDNRESLVQAALANFIQRHPMKGGGSIAIGVSGQSSFARFIKLPPVEPAKIPEIVRFEAIQQIPFPLDDVEWSYQLFRDPQSPDVEVGIFAMRKELVNHYIKFFTDIDLSVELVQMNPLAVYNAMNYEQRLTGTKMIIDMGAENTDLIISEGETIWLRSIPIGGNNFTESLVKAFKLNFAKAEELKRNAPSSKFAKQIFQAMRPIFADLVSEIQRSIGFYASVHRESRISKILALGGTFRLPGLQKYLQQNLQLDVERVDSYSIGQPSDAKLAASYNENLLSIVSAYGLAVQAMGDGKINSSLLPEKIRRERMWRDKTKWFGLAAACFVVGAGIGYTRYLAEDFRLKVAAEKVQPEINQTQQDASRNDRDWAEIESKGGPDRARISAIRSLESYRTLWTDILADIHGVLPAPSPALLAGNVAEIKKLPRDQRQEIRIDSISTQYRNDLDRILADSDFKKFISESATPVMSADLPMSQPGYDMMPGGYPGGMPGGYPPGMPGGYPGMEDPSFGAPPGALPGGTTDPNAKRGFLITLRVTTPYGKAYGFLDKELVKKLTAMTQAVMPPDKKFFIAKAEIVNVIPLRQDTIKVAALQAAWAASAKDRLQVPGGGMNLPGNFAPPPGNPFGMMGAPMAPGQDMGAFADRLTGEDMQNDWDCTILMAVVIDPPPIQTASK